MEVWLYLVPLLPERSPAWLALLALLTETANQLITWAATIVPGGFGVVEGNAYVLFGQLGLGAVTGFALALVRRIRMLVSVAHRPRGGGDGRAARLRAGRPSAGLREVAVGLAGRADAADRAAGLAALGRPPLALEVRRGVVGERLAEGGARVRAPVHDPCSST